MKHLAAQLMMASVILVFAGCGSKEPHSVTDGADAEALAEYDRLIAEEEQAADNDGS